MFRRKPKAPRISPEGSVYEEVDTGDDDDWIMNRTGRRILVDKIRTRAKQINVQVIRRSWIDKLAAQGKRPLGPVRRCDLT